MQSKGRRVVTVRAHIFFGVLLSAFSVVAALLSAAAFTPAILLFGAFLPCAVALAWQGSLWSAFMVLASFVIALVLSPIKLPEILAFPSITAFTVLCVLALLVAVLHGWHYKAEVS